MIFYISPNIIWLIKSIRMECVELVACMEVGTVQTSFGEESEGKR
jgi:hypothetical protein